MINNRLLLKTEYQLPSFNKKIWKNRGLYSKYQYIQKSPLTIIRGSLGVGKTTTLLDYLQRNSKAVLYLYSIKDTDIDEVDFWIKILECFKYNNPNLSKDINSLVASKVKEKPSLNHLIQELNDLIKEELPNELIFVIDNFDRVCENQNLLDSLVTFIDNMATSFHLVLVSRKNFTLSKGFYWKIIGNLLEIGQDDFRLDNQEVESFLANKYKLILSESEIRRLNNWAEGWITAIDMVARRLSSGIDFEDAFDIKTLRAIFTYFQYELVDEIEGDAHYKQFLAQTRVLKELDIGICNQLLDTEDSQEILETLIDKGFFIRQLGGDQYRYHNLFYSFLNHHFTDLYDNKELYNRVKKIYLQDDNINKVIEYTMKSGEEEQLIELAEDKGTEWIEHRREDLLERILEFLSQEVFANHPLLYIYKGDLSFQKGEVESALNYYQQVENSVTDIEVKVISLFRIAKYYTFFLSSDLLNYLKKLDSYKDRFTQSQQQEFFYYQANYHMFKGNLSKVKELLNNLDKKDNLYYELSLQADIIEGNFDNLEHQIRKLLGDNGSSNFVDNSFIFDFYYLSIGKIFKVEEYILEYPRIDRPVFQWFKKYLLLNVNEFFFFYDLKAVKENYLCLQDRINKLPFNFSWIKIELLYKLSLWESFYGYGEEGLKYAAQGLRASLENNNVLVKCIFLRCMAVNLYSLKNLLKAKKLLKKSINAAQIIDSRIQCCYGLLWLSLLYYEEDNIMEFKDNFRKVLNIAKEEGYDYIFLKDTIFGVRDTNRLIPLLLKAKGLDIEKDYINSLLDKADLKEIERAAGYSLRIRSFGSLKIYRGNLEVREEEWTRRKAKELFKLFLVNSASMIHRDQLCSLLWPTKDRNKAENNFYVTLNALNKILEPDREGKQETYFIKNEGSYYGLKDSFTYLYDVELFRDFINRGQVASKEAIKINYYQKAVELYTGDYLRDFLKFNQVNQEREELKLEFLNIAKELMAYYYQTNNYKETVEIANRILDVDKYFEDAYLYKMKSYYKQGLSDFALDIYHNYKKILEGDFKIKVAAKLKDYYNSISNQLV